MPGLVHRYPDRVLFLVHRLLLHLLPLLHALAGRGHSGEYSLQPARSAGRAIDYIAAHPEIRDVLISGGDPLTLADDGSTGCSAGCARSRTSSSCASAPRCRRCCRSGSRRALVRMLRQHPPAVDEHPLHPPRRADAGGRARPARRLADAGIPLGSQTVLLKGVNDDVGR